MRPTLDSMRCGWPKSISSRGAPSFGAAPIASAIAARTRRMKIGIAVQVLPLCHPLRLAEEAATVDQLSHGRLIFGVGRSGVVQTYEAYRVPDAESRDRFLEILDIVEPAWTEDLLVRRPVSQLQGRPRSAEALPKAAAGDPHRRQHPRHLPGDRRAGLPVFATTRHRLGTICPHIQAYYDAWEEAGHPGRGQVFVSAPIYLAETEERAREEPKKASPTSTGSRTS